MDKMYCRGCDTNWSRLATIDEEGDEQYEFCPICQTDAHLEEGRLRPTFSFDAILGHIYNDWTGAVVFEDLPPPPQVKPPSSRDRFNESVLRGRHKG